MILLFQSSAPPPAPGPGLTVGLDLGLGGIFRNLLITAGDIVSAWAFSEISKGITRDIANDKNPGVWTSVGGFSRGVAGDLPEGNLCVTTDGTGHVIVANDSAGYYMPGDATARTLSCAGGDINGVALVKFTSSATMVYAEKRDDVGGGSDNGWSMYFDTGAVGFTFTKAGTGIFGFTRGSVNDGDFHLVQWSYDAAAGEAKIIIDGAQSGSTVSVTPTDPSLSSSDLYLLSRGGSSLKFVGTSSYFAISRNADVGLSTLLQATRSWTDVTSHVNATEGIDLQEGIQSISIRDRQAAPGSVAFTLNNTPSLSGTITLGYYTIGHVNQRPGFDLGIPVRLREGSTIHFRGRLAKADPEPGVKAGRRTFCLAYDWYATAARTEIGHLALQTNAASNTAWTLLVDEAEYPPVAVQVSVGSETFPFVFDRVDGVMLSEMSRVITSEVGYGFPRPDMNTGGVIVFEGRGTRQLSTSPVATYDSTMREMQVSLGNQTLINRIIGTVTPRAAGASATTVLYVQDRRQQIAPGESLTVEGSYQDPAQSRSSIGGTDFQTFTPGTDYTFTGNEDGTGGDYASSLRVDPSGLDPFGGSGFKLTFTNTHPSIVGWLSFQIRGRPLYTDTPLPIKVEKRTSIRTYGLAKQDVDFAYLNDAETATSIANLELSLFATPTRVPESVTFSPQPGSALETSILARACGDLIAIGESMSAITTTQRFWIQSRRLLFTGVAGGLVRVDATFGLFPSFAAGEDDFAEWNGSNWASDADQGLWGF